MRRCALIFPGQGSQAVGMGRAFYDARDDMRDMVKEASDVLGFDMAELLFGENDRLAQTAYTQPAILLVGAMAERWLRSECELDVAFALGHSLGEFSALNSAGALPLGSALKLVHERGKLMQESCDGIDAGMMVVLGLDDSVMEDFCENERKSGAQIWAANYNGEGQIVLAGKRADLAEREGVIKSLGAKRALLLPMSVASHCPLLGGMQERFLAHMEGAILDSFAYPVISNVTSNPYNNKSDAIKLLSSQLISPVLYKQSIKKHDEKVELYIECGHGGVLKGLNRRLSGKPTISIEKPSDIDELQKNLRNQA
ncbi:MAG: ACP S-malonyltransferase [Wolinella sp.]